MAVKREMTVTIGEDGNVEIAVDGVKGKGCLDFTKWLEEELGVVVNRTQTSEYYQSEVSEVDEVKVGE